MVSKRNILAEIAVREARAGNYGLLRARFLYGRTPLTEAERQVIAEGLDRLDGKRGKAEDRRIEKMLMGERVVDLSAELGSTEAAVAQVMKERGRKRSTVFKALKESKKTR